MSGTHAGPSLAGYRDMVTELTNQGASFGDVEDAIDTLGGLTADQKGALWLFAFSLRARADQQRDARAHLTGVQAAADDSEVTARGRAPALSEALAASLSEQAGAERYRRSQSAARSGKAPASDRARPSESDAGGSSVPQRNRSFLERVVRLLKAQ